MHPRESVHHAVHHGETEQREREPDEHLLRDHQRILGRDEHDRRADERGEQRTHADGHQIAASQGGDTLGQRGVMRDARFLGNHVGIEPGLEDVVRVDLRNGRPDLGTFRAGEADGIAHHVGDALLCGAFGERELAVVLGAALGIAQDAARVIDEPQRLLDVALSVARLAVVLADVPAQRSAHFLRGSVLRYPEGFVQGGSHGRRREMPAGGNVTRRLFDETSPAGK